MKWPFWNSWEATTIKEETKPIKRHPTRKFFFFPYNESRMSWSLFNTNIELQFHRLKDYLGTFYFGGFTYEEQGLGIINHLLQTGWLPPDMTKEDIEKIKISLMPKKDNEI